MVTVVSSEKSPFELESVTIVYVLGYAESDALASL